MNKRIFTAFAVLLVLGAAASFGAYRLGQRSMQPDTAGPTAAARKILYWEDPMVPGKRFDKPGKSPFMDMDLVPVYAEQQPEGGAVQVSHGVQQNLGIRYAEVRQASLGAVLRLVGNVAFDERERVVVQARANGFVEHLYVRAPLDPVRKGQPVLDLYVPDWVAVQEDYLSIKRMGSTQAAGLLDAAIQRMRLAGMNDEQIHQVVARGQVLRRTTVAAPASGVVSELTAREGMTVMAGAPLMTISGLRSVWVNAEVPESAAAQVRPGATVRATTPAYPGAAFGGKVEALLPQVDPATRTLTARIVVANPGNKLTPGMFANIEVLPTQQRKTFLVPSEAVISTGTRTVVILAEADGKFRPVEVSVGAESAGETEILSGVSAGQRVVASGQFLIDSEASLRAGLVRLGSADQSGAQQVPAPAPAAAPTHRGHGRIEQIGREQVTISHEAIPSLHWGPMTMGFAPPPAGIPPGLKVGDRVDFEIRALPDGRFQIVAVRPERVAPATRQAPPKHDHGATMEQVPAAPVEPGEGTQHDHSGAAQADRGGHQ